MKPRVPLTHHPFDKWRFAAIVGVLCPFVGMANEGDHEDSLADPIKNHDDRGASAVVRKILDATATTDAPRVDLASAEAQWAWGDPEPLGGGGGGKGILGGIADWQYEAATREVQAFTTEQLVRRACWTGFRSGDGKGGRNGANLPVGLLAPETCDMLDEVPARQLFGTPDVLKKAVLTDLLGVPRVATAIGLADAIERGDGDGAALALRALALTTDWAEEVLSCALDLDDTSCDEIDASCFDDPLSCLGDLNVPSVRAAIEAELERPRFGRRKLEESEIAKALEKLDGLIAGEDGDSTERAEWTALLEDLTGTITGAPAEVVPGQLLAHALDAGVMIQRRHYAAFGVRRAVGFHPVSSSTRASNSSHLPALA